MSQAFWNPDPEKIGATAMSRFARFAENVSGREFKDYNQLHRWSIEDLEASWRSISEFVQIRWQTPPQKTMVWSESKRMSETQWFPGAYLNFAQNLLPEPSSRVVLIGLTESQDESRYFTGLELWNNVAACAHSLARAGVGPGVRVAGVLANIPEAIIAMLATAALGGIWTSCSPDFGINGIVDRLGQIEPSVLFLSQAYVYNAKPFLSGALAEQLLRRIPSIKTLVSVNHLHMPHEKSYGMVWSEFLKSGGIDVSAKTPQAIPFAKLPFDHPLYILFSSGTTGAPKCIIHAAGRTLLQHKKELMIHSDLGADDRLLFYTTTGWMMWNWMASGLSVGSTVVVFDGAPSRNRFKMLWKLAEQEKVTVLGTSPKFIQGCMEIGLDVSRQFNFQSLKSILTTGSPLLPEHFDWLAQAVKPGIRVSSISGGTDIISCFMLGNPNLPVHRGEIQCLGLGMAVETWDDAGLPIMRGKGELVCTRPFVSMPLGFWGDQDGSKYRRSYFSRYPQKEVWHHGDFIEITEYGGVIVYGRSDATLNPGGVRIGTSEIYRYAERVKGVGDCVAVSYRHAGNDDVLLFVKPSESAVVDGQMRQDIRKSIRESLTQRHIPKLILGVRDIPYTRSGKKVELAISETLMGTQVRNLEAIANPESLDEYIAWGKKLKDHYVEE